MPQGFYRSPFQLDHIVARQHGGESIPANLAISCFHCNTHKGPNLAGIDHMTNKLVRLYHPRRDEWAEHFRWNGPILEGLTAVGRVTIQVLSINDSQYVDVRRALMDEGVFPPSIS